MSNTLPAPTEGLVYTNPTTGKRMKFSDGCWKSIDYLPLDGSDSMQGTLWTPDQMINGNTLTASRVSFAEDPDAIENWQDYPLVQADLWTSITYGNGQFVAVSMEAYSYNNKEQGMRSEDGINWTPTDMRPESQSTLGWSGITYGDGKFVAVAFHGYNRVGYSEDGINWSNARSYNESTSWSDVAYGIGSDGIGRFVAVAASTTNLTGMYAESGSITSWKNITTVGGGEKQYSITYGIGSDGVGRFVSVGNKRIMYSDDGKIFFGVDDAQINSNSWQSVAYGDGKFVAVAASGSNRVAYSEDGINWTTVPSGNEDMSWRAIAYGAGTFVAVAGDYAGVNHRVETTGKRMMYSTDGINWTNIASTNDSIEWMTIAWGGDKFVALGAGGAWSGGSNHLMTIYAPENPLNLYFNGDPVVVDTGLQKSLATLLSTQSRQLGRTRYYQDSALPTGDSYDYPDGSLWYQPTSNNLHFYNDSDQTWVQL